MSTEHSSLQAVNFCLGKLCVIKNGKICPMPKHIKTGFTIMFFAKVPGLTDQWARKIEELFFLYFVAKRFRMAALRSKVLQRSEVRNQVRFVLIRAISSP